jgi:hypothetical protein
LEKVQKNTNKNGKRNSRLWGVAKKGAKLEGKNEFQFIYYVFF